MLEFAERTGLGSGRASPRRYLWTDAFAVCNFLALRDATGDPRYLDLAVELVDQVHRVLGRHRPDDARSGWISGLAEREGERHPTRGGLRIGKPLPERGAEEPFDEALEWERDGQYFHYLTRWMHALDQLARATREARFNTWARELAQAAHRAFAVTGPDGRRRMVWKRSIDLTRTLVSAMGQHDPLDGYVTCLQLQTTAAEISGAAAVPDLREALSDFGRMLGDVDLATSDPLGLGGLLVDAARIAQLDGAAHPRPLLEALLTAVQAGLAHRDWTRDLRLPASQRVAFRELGLAIGLAGLAPLERALAGRAASQAVPSGIRARLAALKGHAPLGSAILSFWSDPASHDTGLWSEHRDIDEVMLATAHAPSGLVQLGALR
jgi:hypothetical protein